MNSRPLSPEYLRLRRDPDRGLRLEELPPGSPPSPGYVRVVCISDTHLRTKQLTLPQGDILIHAGDFTQTGHRSEILAFRNWLESCQFPEKVVIAGNHELSFDRAYMDSGGKHLSSRLHIDPQEDVTELLGHCTYLQDTSTIIRGLKVYGSPWQPAFCYGAFNLSRSSDLRETWSKIPSDTDILVTHGPPRGICDLVPDVGRVGCAELSDAVRRFRPVLHVFGHIHEGHGRHFDGQTLFVNASLCDRQVRPVNGPFVIDLPERGLVGGMGGGRAGC